MNIKRLIALSIFIVIAALAATPASAKSGADKQITEVYDNLRVQCARQIAAGQAEPDACIAASRMEREGLVQPPSQRSSWRDRVRVSGFVSIGLGLGRGHYGYGGYRGPYLGRYAGHTFRPPRPSGRR